QVGHPSFSFSLQFPPYSPVGQGHHGILSGSLSGSEWATGMPPYRSHSLLSLGHSPQRLPLPPRLGSALCFSGAQFVALPISIGPTRLRAFTVSMWFSTTVNSGSVTSNQVRLPPFARACPSCPTLPRP